eukprot:m.329761 g.329761  ORF g.329761 m.329761 type:complete len:76 (+) comp16040_c1_seq2:981-1208(+)
MGRFCAAAQTTLTSTKPKHVKMADTSLTQLTITCYCNDTTSLHPILILPTAFKSTYTLEIASISPLLYGRWIQCF